MVARADPSMYGPTSYPNTYSYRLWSLANVWSNCQIQPLQSNPPSLDLKSESPDPESDRAIAGTPPLGPGGPYKCPQCGGAYPNLEQLERHEILHSPSTQTCKQCNKSFANVYRLQRHMISHDESALLRKFKCNDCDKAFKFKHHLKEHLRIHSGEKPFECGNCGKKFSHSGSYSSHMTSKKCLVMNLKMGRIKPNNPALNPNRSPSRKRPSAAVVASLSNNLANGNGYLPMLPKYNEAAAAAFLASIAHQDGGFPNPALMPHNLHQFYIPPALPMNPAAGLNPYNFPAPLSRFFESIASAQMHQRKIEDQLKAKVGFPSDNEDMNDDQRDDTERRSSMSSDGELVMDIEGDSEQTIALKREKLEDHSTEPPEQYLHRPYENNSLDRNQEYFRPNLQSPVSARTCPSRDPPTSPRIKIEQDPDKLSCSKCHTMFNHKTELLQHEQVLCVNNLFRKHESLAAQMSETLALNRLEAEMRASIHSGASGSEDEEFAKDDIEKKSSVEQEKKIRFRTAINDKQLETLKEHYDHNPRPNREELRNIAQHLGLENKVVQVWFQNNRARIRRLSGMQSMETSFEQPLDLSTKRSSPIPNASPLPSPPCSSLAHSDSGEEAINLSQKSSRSTTPYINFHGNYAHSNCSSSEFRHSPSPGESLNGFRAPHQRGYNLLPVEKLMHYNDLSSRSPLLNPHLNNEFSHSPGFEKRAWNEDMHSIETDDQKLKNKMKDGKETEGQYVCDECDKTFVKQSSLARHKYEHSGQRPYKCIECPKAFKHKHHLVEHKRLHTGEKPFQCIKCLKKFSHSGSYSQHMNHRYSYCKPYRVEAKREVKMQVPHATISHC